MHDVNHVTAYCSELEGIFCLFKSIEYLVINLRDLTLTHWCDYERAVIKSNEFKPDVDLILAIHHLKSRSWSFNHFAAMCTAANKTANAQEPDFLSWFYNKFIRCLWYWKMPPPFLNLTPKIQNGGGISRIPDINVGM